MTLWWRLQGWPVRRAAEASEFFGKIAGGTEKTLGKGLTRPPKTGYTLEYMPLNWLAGWH